ncbi:glycosyltransferase 87 family protein [Actinocatenispora rupis]|uniref:Membrane protein n=1 Tax=Actinocatenispora rupis TaxID=519421 RepID=A0A8J3NDT9_9ACTN|nr:membrane protein [Actinocatenispora rupis]
MVAGERLPVAGGGGQVAVARAGRIDPYADEPAREDWFVRGVSEAVGGPLGDHAVRPPRRGFWTPVRIVLALACLLFALHWVQKSPCRDGAWVNLKQYKDLCYTDVVALYYAEGLGEGQVPYADHKVEYPVLTGLFMGAVGLPVHAVGQALGPAFNQGKWFYDANALILCGLGVGTVAMVLALRRRRPWDALLLAVAPAMLFTATVNWDLLAIAPTVGALVAWARRKPALAGLLLGLGVAAKFYPLLILGPLLVLALRSGKLRQAGMTVLTAAATWLVVNLPFAVFFRDAWLEFFRLNSTRGVDWGTFWYIGAHFPRGRDGAGFFPFTWLSTHIPALNLLYGVLFAVCCLGIAALAILAPRRPRLAQLAFLVVACFLLTGKVWSQQYVLWLIPLAVLARPRWGAFLAWQLAEVGYFLAFYAELMGASGKGVIPEWVFVFFAVARLITLAVLVGYVVRDVLRPDRDAVRADGADDPDGGVLDGAPDAAWLPNRRRVDRFHVPVPS